MKKLSFLVLVIIFSCAVLSVYSEGSNVVDFDNLSSISDTDLISYKNLIETELSNRGLSTALYDGDYLVGRDIAPGYYTIKFFAYSPGYSNSNSHLGVYVYISQDIMDSYFKREIDKQVDATVIQKELRDSGELQIFLEEGQVVNVWGTHKESATFIEKATPLFMD